MKILVVSPIELPYTVGCRYSGLERLAVQFAEEWAKLGHQVSLIAHKDTNVHSSVRLLPCDGYETIKRPQHAEIMAFLSYQSEMYKHDIIWDIGHKHIPALYMSQLPTVNVFSANPEYEARDGHKKAAYNLISWSRWGVTQIRKWYHCESKYQETIMVDPEVFKPKGKRGERYLTLGRMAEPKGNLNAVLLCKDLGLPLDVAGGRGSERTAGDTLTDYEKEVISQCDGKQIVYHGEVSDEEKVELMQSCKALIYMTNHVEITSHKVQEAMLCGAPVMVPNLGGMPEIVTHGVDGYLCDNAKGYIEALKFLNRLEPAKTRVQLVNKYKPSIVAENYVKLFEKVAGGLRW